MLKQHRAREGITQRAGAGCNDARAQTSGQQVGGPQRQGQMAQHVRPPGPVPAGHHGEDELARIEDRGRGIGGQRLAEVFIGVPKGHAPGGPLLVHVAIKGRIVMAGIAKGEQLTAKQHAAKTPGANGQRANEQNHAGA